MVAGTVFANWLCASALALGFSFLEGYGMRAGNWHGSGPKLNPKELARLEHTERTTFWLTFVMGLGISLAIWGLARYALHSSTIGAGGDLRVARAGVHDASGSSRGRVLAAVLRRASPSDDAGAVSRRRFADALRSIPNQASLAGR